MTSEIKNRKAKQPNSAAQFKRAEFINYDLDASDKVRFKEWLGSKTFGFGDTIDKLLESGYTLSVKPDSYHSCVAAYIQPLHEDNPNFGFILSGRSGSGTMAVCGALFRHYVLFEEQWPTDTARRGGLDDE